MKKWPGHAHRLRTSDKRKRMKPLELCMIFTLAIQSLCCADVTKLSAEDRKALFDSSRFHEVHSTNGTPSKILALCDGGGDSKLAEPGQNWNTTDSIIDPTLQGKRLIWAAAVGDYYVGHYERGGVAHTYHILIANDKGKPKPIWRAI